MNNYLKTNFDLNNKELISVIDELPLWSAPFGLALLEKINYRKNITALDIGSGTGFPLLEIAMRLGNSCKLFGIDPWEAAVDRIMAKIKVYSISNVEMITGTAENIPLPDTSIDLIFSNNGLNNVNHVDAVLKECRRVSKIGAQLVFTYNTERTMAEFYSVFEDTLLKNNLKKEISMMKEHIYQKRKPVEEYVGLLNDHGYIVNEIAPAHFVHRYVDGTTMFNHFLIRLAFINSWKEIIPQEKQNKIFTELEEKLNDFAFQHGGLKMTIPFTLIDCIQAEK